MWIEHQNQQNMPLSGMVIQEKAMSLYGNLVKILIIQCLLLPVMGGSSASSHHAFHNLKLTGEAAAAAADHAAAEQFSAVFKSVIADGGCTPSQVFNLDETGLYWKCMPSRTSSPSSSSPSTLA